MKRKIELKESEVTVRADDFGMLITMRQPKRVGLTEQLEVDMTFNDTIELIEFLNKWMWDHVREMKNGG